MKLACPISQFRVAPDKSVKLKKTATKIDPLYTSDDDYESKLASYREEIAHWQSILYAGQQESVLLIFQGMDSAGKGGAIRHVMSGINPQGCQVHSFGRPSEEELAHDYLWRCLLRLPRRGMIGIFDRSYYEEVLVVRVKPEVLAGQNLPADLVKHKNFWKDRFHDIRQHEAYLHRNGTKIIKFFLHVSADEQRERLLARIDDPEKNWKFRLGDLDCRSHWADFQKAYQDCLEQTSTTESPWYIVPADDKRNARLIISQIILQNMQKMELQLPSASPALIQDLATARKLLQDEVAER
ncbi:MAG: polyphosphate kinase 2 family protein [Planctomycetaceae bacterium]|jgi:PPK2 family polyphosphate:nucleotide phosphotransferase|nr:polyphosphate kinase 2 family protein [Planctomycetaceae bacterium]